MTVDAVYLFENYHERERQWLSARIANPSDADDVLANAYLRATQFLSDEPVVTHPSTWFRSIVRNCWVDFIRYCNRQKRPDRYCVELTPELVTVPGPDYRHGRAAQETLAQLMDSARLSSAERNVVELRMDGVAPSETARILGMSFVAVHEYYASALDRMREAGYEEPRYD